jgi:ferredoxin
MHISIDSERCQGHALCLGLAPHLLDFDDEAGHAVARAGAVPSELEASAARAARSCPEGAVTLRG